MPGACCGLSCLELLVLLRPRKRLATRRNRRRATLAIIPWPSLPNPYSAGIGDLINQYFISQLPSTPVRIARLIIIQEVQALIQNNVGRNTSISVLPFGGTAYQVDSATSDLDLIIVDHQRQSGFSPNVSTDISRLPKPYNMRWLADLLRRNGFVRVQPIPTASVPIVKFYDPRSSINIDINCNAQLGDFNTCLIKKYCEYYPQLRAMIFFLKKWARIRLLNDPTGQGSGGMRSLSSYCYALMAVAYLQIRGVLPNLQSQSAIHNAESKEFWVNHGDVRICCDTRIGEVTNFRAVSLSLGDALYGWFRYFGFDHIYGVNALSVRQGGAFAYRDLLNSTNNISPYSKSGYRIGPQAEDLRSSLLIVQDPFILSKNISKSCDDRVIQDFQLQCKNTAINMEVGFSVHTLLTTCV